MEPELKDWLNSINFNKDDLTEDDEHIIKSYPPFIINKCLSGHIDSVLFANEMNRYHFLDKDMQYKFYLNTNAPTCPGRSSSSDPGICKRQSRRPSNCTIDQKAKIHSDR